jgi:hypothetical protein
MGRFDNQVPIANQTEYVLAFRNAGLVLSWFADVEDSVG